MRPALLAAALGFAALGCTRDGEASPVAESPAFALRVWGRDAPGRPLRALADFSTTSELTVPLSAELQYFVAPPPRPGRAVLVKTGGPTHAQLDRGGFSAEALAPVGKPFAAGVFGPSELEVCAVEAAESVATFDEAVKAGAVKRCGTLRLSP